LEELEIGAHVINCTGKYPPHLTKISRKLLTSGPGPRQQRDFLAGIMPGQKTESPGCGPSECVNTIKSVLLVADGEEVSAQICRPVPASRIACSCIGERLRQVLPPILKTGIAMGMNPRCSAGGFIQLFYEGKSQLASGKQRVFQLL
jgi:hypothetical protein